MVLCLGTIARLISATNVKQDEVKSWRDDNENFIQHISELLAYQSQKITSQAEEIAELRSEQASILQAMKDMSESNQQAMKDMCESNQQALRAMSESIQLQTEKIQSQAREIEELRHLQAEKNEKTGQDQQADKVKKDVSRRIVLHSDVDILSLVNTHSTDIKNLQHNMTTSNREIQAVQNEVATMKRGLATKASGSTYVRWGRKTCPAVNGTKLVYSGFTGGSHYTDPGAASNYVCLSPNPLWGHYNDAHDSSATIYGAEYELNAAGGSSQFFGTNVHNEDAPCSVCRSSRPTVIMIPGRNQCYPGWTMEYKGYLVAGAASLTAASEYVCLDDRPEVLQSGHADRDGKLFYFVEGRDGALPCPPYVDGRELTCVVCTK